MATMVGLFSSIGEHMPIFRQDKMVEATPESWVSGIRTPLFYFNLSSLFNHHYPHNSSDYYPDHPHNQSEQARSASSIIHSLSFCFSHPLFQPVINILILNILVVLIIVIILIVIIVLIIVILRIKVNKLHYRITCMLLLVAVLLVTCTEWISGPIIIASLERF